MNPPDGPKPYGVRAYVEAWQVTAENYGQVAQWCGGRAGIERLVDFQDDDGTIRTAEVGDWVIRGTTGSFFALSDDTFCRHYYREDSPAKVTRGVLTGEELRITDGRR